jgi:dienelactone hydrolase
MADATGLWHLDVENNTDDHERISIDVRGNAGGPLVQWIATVKNDSGRFETVENIQWANLSPNRATFKFVRKYSLGPIAPVVEVIEGWVVDGIFVGRFSRTGGLLLAESGAITGWNQDGIDGTGLTPRVFEIDVPAFWLAPATRHTLRIDRGASAGVFIATVKDFDGGDCLEYAAKIDHWDGRVLRFSYNNQKFQGVVEGRRVAGAILPSGRAWHGIRTEVLTAGFYPPADPGQMRRRIQHLMMGENPKPATPTLTWSKGSVLAQTQPDSSRDDDPKSSPAKDQDYNVWNVQLSCPVTDPRTGGSHTRKIYGYLTQPTTTVPMPAGGWPAVVVVNGHGGGMNQMMNPNIAQWWYGDGFACRPYVVFALDIGHRPDADRGTPSLYHDQDAGNQDHPAIRFNGDPMWSEDGERAWDAIRVLEFLRGEGAADDTGVVATVNKNKIIVAGLSMGGEVTAYAAAMEEKFAAAVPAGYGRELPEFFRMTNRRSGASCMQWTHANVIEYINISDLHALIAPRPLIAVAGVNEGESTRCKQPFRRSRAAYGAAASTFFVHYAHDDAHTFRWAGKAHNVLFKPFVRTPAYPGPASPPTGNWQTDQSTTLMYLPPVATPGTLYDWLKHFGF